MKKKFFLIAKSIPLNPSKLKAHYKESLQVIGDGKSAVDIADLAPHESRDRLILNLHGLPDGVSFDQENIIHPSALLKK